MQRKNKRLVFERLYFCDHHMAQHRILIVTNRVPYPLNDGGSLAMHAMIEGYHQAGWEVFLLSMNTSRHYVSLEVLPPLYRTIRFEAFDINTDVRIVPTLVNFFLSRKPNHAERFYEKDFATKLERIIEDFEAELIQLESIYLATYLSNIKAATRAPIAMRLHNIEFQIWERLANEATTFRKYYLRDLCARIKKFEVAAWHQADVLIAITETDAELVRTLAPDKDIVTVPFGINTQALGIVSKEQEWVGYHIGAMDWMPNAEAISWFLDEVWPELHKEVPSFRFHFAGRNMPGSFEKYEHDGVTCAGEVEDAGQFIADKKILIVPLRSGGGIRIKILEALAAGKLVISTSVGMQGIEGVEAGVHYLPAETKDDFIRQVKWTVEHIPEAERIAENGAKLVRTRYDQADIMAHLLSHIDQIV
jgi:polysaccharide biosynthesis protein PslH